MRAYAGLIVLALMLGCCGYVPEPTPPANTSANTTVSSGVAPVTQLELNATQGYAPFWVHYNFMCWDRDNDLVSCTLSLDGQEFASGKDQNSVFSDNYTYPQFYRDAMNAPGTHELEVVATDAAGHTSSSNVQFTVLAPEALTKQGWYTCNMANASPCDAYMRVYCPNIMPTNLQVREAASSAINGHPGAYSANQILDIYDWVYSNVIYQNVPVNLTYQPYPPNETLDTKSGDCKNQAVLMASMIEAVGGTARVLVIPDCTHAFTEVFRGNRSNANRVIDAIFAHYGYAPNVTWHTDSDGNVWLPLDTAGGRYPGNSIGDCFNSSQVFVVYNCVTWNRSETRAPDTSWIEYGPKTLTNTSAVLDAGYWRYYEYTMDGSTYEYCKYSVNVTSHSGDLDWYIIPANQYTSFKDGNSFTYYHEEKQVPSGSSDFVDGDSGPFRLIVSNAEGSRPMTAFVSVVSRCYKKG
ncbi:Transglutaminase-like superfamily protein [uncultured archaeon]|nr:Transglutaminase-like superfamily protein [uncultured archaeon]